MWPPSPWTHQAGTLHLQATPPGRGTPILSFTKFLDTISRFVPAPPSGVQDAIARLDPHKIYLENVRSMLGVSSRQARTICESAVRQGVFERKVEIVCPDGSVAVSTDAESELPKTVRCWREEDGAFELTEMDTNALRKTVFYTLK